MFDRYRLEIAFAHRTFAWGSDARGKAHVHVVVIGLVQGDKEPAMKRLFSYEDINGDPTESQHKALTPYLFDASALADRHLVVHETNNQISGAPKLIIGSKPIDKGYYIFDAAKRTAFLNREPRTAGYPRPFVGSKEFINGNERWILALDAAHTGDLRAMPAVIERIEAVKRMRLASPSRPTQQLALTPTRYHVTVIPDQSSFVIPEVSSERRDYIPMGWLEPPTIPSNLLRVLLDADLYHFGILTSRMHMAWLRHIGGRLKSDYRYSIGLVYNTFPWTMVSKAQQQKICTLAQTVLDIRAKYTGVTLADLYDPTLMKTDLRKAHQALDSAVDNSIDQPLLLVIVIEWNIYSAFMKRMLPP